MSGVDGRDVDVEARGVPPAELWNQSLNLIRVIKGLRLCLVPGLAQVDPLTVGFAGAANESDPVCRRSKRFSLAPPSLDFGLMVTSQRLSNVSGLAFHTSVGRSAKSFMPASLGCVCRPSAV